MFYKFVGGDDAAVADVLDKVLAGSIKFTSAAQFNDPFEFKFSSIAPTREVFDDWHARHDPDRSTEELEEGWRSFSGPAADWNTAYAPRLNLLSTLFVLCLAQRWDSHLMWAHYTSAHRGFAVEYHPTILDEISKHPDFFDANQITYQGEPPALRWFHGSREDMLGPLLFTKAEDWSYEQEYRLVIAGDAGDALFTTIAPGFVAGIILGPRAPAALRARAIAAQSLRPDLRLRQITAAAGYEMKLVDIEAGVVRATHIL